MAALQETRRAGEGQLREEGGGYTFFWRGKPEDQPRIRGVGFAIKNVLVNRLLEFPVSINECLMTLRLQLAKNQQATVVCAYAPTLVSDDESKENFISVRIPSSPKSQRKTRSSYLETLMPESERISNFGEGRSEGKE